MSVGFRVVAVVELSLEERIPGRPERLRGGIEFSEDLVCLENGEKVRMIPRSGLSEHEYEDHFKFLG